MRGLRRLVHLIWGEEVDRALRPVLAITFVGMLASSTGFTFIGVWALKELGAGARELSFAFLVGAVVSAVTGYVGGHLSDHFGRRRLILIGEGLAMVAPLLFLVVGHRVLLGLAAMVLWGAFRSFSGAASNALIADLVPRDRHEEAYAAIRVTSNLGVTVGPPLGSLMLVAGDWTGFFVGVAVLALVSRVVAWRLLPERGRFAPESPPERGSFGVIRADRLFLLLLVANTFAQIVYIAYETVMPISLVDSHGIESWQWGLLVVVNPLLVTLFQLRLTRRLGGTDPAARFAAAVLLMGLPFLLLGVSSAIPVILVVLVLFVVGEMLWVPTAQSMVTARAPVDIRGAYMGAFSTTGAVGFALTPFLGLQVRAAAGDLAMWAVFAAIAGVGAAVGVVACRSISGSRPSAVLEV